MIPQPRDPATGRMLAGATALERFAAKCRFEPTTGCVVWIGGTTSAHGREQRYGSFWDSGRRWLAHRWAAVHIHGYNLGEHQAGHCCPGGPNTLCVQHIEPQTNLENSTEQHARLGNPAHRATQTARERQFWLFVALGMEQPPPAQEIDPDAIPFHEPPAWLRPFLDRPENDDDCPF